MPTALSDPSTVLYGILVIMVLVLAGILFREQKRGDLIRFLAGLAVLVAVFLTDRLIESPREEASRKIEEMAKSSQEKRWDDVFKHFSETFKYKGTTGMEMDKKKLYSEVMANRNVVESKGFAILDLHRAVRA